MSEEAVQKKGPKIKLNTITLIMVGGLSLLFLFTFKYTYNEKVEFLGDNINYYCLGRAIANGHGYVNSFQPQMNPATYYPPGYPYIISVGIGIAGESTNAIKNINGLFLLGSILVFFFFVKHITENRNLALVLAVLITLNYWLLMYGSIMMSEISFLFISILSLFLVSKIDYDKKFFKDPYLISAAILIGLSYYVRGVGIALFGAVFLYHLINKRWAHLGVFLGLFGLINLPWYLRGKELGAQSAAVTAFFQKKYQQPEAGTIGFGDIISRIEENADRYLSKEIPSGLFPSIDVGYQKGAPNYEGYYLLGFLCVGLSIFGIVKLKKYRVLIGCYFLCYLGIFMMWPTVWYGTRYLVPLIPLIALGFYHGIMALVEFLFSKANITLKVSPFVFLIAIFVYFPTLKNLKEQAAEPHGPQYQSFYAAAEWIKNNTSDTVVVANRKPGIFHFYSDRFSLRYKYSAIPDTVINHMDRISIDYVIIDCFDAKTRQFLIPAIQAKSSRFRLVQKIPASGPPQYQTQIVQLLPK